jgi:hypothetical protein
MCEEADTFVVLAQARLGDQILGLVLSVSLVVPLLTLQWRHLHAQCVLGTRCLSVCGTAHVSCTSV